MRSSDGEVSRWPSSISACRARPASMCSSNIAPPARSTAVVIITAQNTLDNAVEAMKRGALDYLVKPFSIADVTALAERARSTRALQREVRELRREVARGVSPGGERLVGSSPALLEIFKTVGKVAVRNVPVADHRRERHG